MKAKFLLVATLLILVTASNCGYIGIDCRNCSGLAGDFYQIIYPDHFELYRTGSDPDGCVFYPKRGYNCSQIIALATRPRVFFATTSSFNLQSPPATFTFQGEGIDITYGMPRVDYYDQYGNSVGSAMATAVAPDGTWVQANTPDLSQVYSGNYEVQICNMTWTSYYQPFGEATLNAWGRDRPDADSDGWTSDQDCDDNDPNVNPSASPDCQQYLYYDRNCNGTSDYDECYGGGGPGCCGPGCYCY